MHFRYAICWVSGTPDFLQPTEDKVQAIKAAPVPTDVTQLCSFVGLVNFYGKFLSSELVPLYALLQKGSKWKWGAQKNEVFQQSSYS